MFPGRVLAPISSARAICRPQKRLLRGRVWRGVEGVRLSHTEDGSEVLPDLVWGRSLIPVSDLPLCGIDFDFYFYVKRIPKAKGR